MAAVGLRKTWLFSHRSVRVQKAVRVGSEARRHAEAVHLVINETRWRWLKVFIFFKFLQDGLAFQLADVRPGSPYFITNDTHEAQVVVSLTLLASFLV